MKLLKELTEQVIDLNCVLSEAIKTYIDTDKTVGNLVKAGQNANSVALLKNPKISLPAMKQALDSYDIFVKNNRYTAQLFAKTMQDRKLYGAMVKDLMKTGNYKLERSTQTNNGYIWVLRRNNTN